MSKGYYSLVQYCPDLSRLEVANIGVLLFCPEQAFLQARLTQNNERISHFFGREGHDWKQISSFKKGFEARVENEKTQVSSLDDLRVFIDRRANLIHLTPPRPMKVSDSATDLDRLFDELIGEKKQQKRTGNFIRYVGEKFIAAGLDNKIRRDLTVRVDVFDRDVDIPFGFQNGRFNLLTPITFEAKDPRSSEDRACRYAVEGKSLYENPDPELGELQLTVIGRFPAKDVETEKRVSRVFKDVGVRLFRDEHLPNLIDEIHRTGKVLSQSGELD
jgi:hypothetical protein